VESLQEMLPGIRGGDGDGNGDGGDSSALVKMPLITRTQEFLRVFLSRRVAIVEVGSWLRNWKNLLITGWRFRGHLRFELELACTLREFVSSYSLDC